MSTTKVIRYTTAPDRADENERLIRAVFADLASDAPAGLTYTSMRLADGQSFVHVVTFDSDDDPLARSTAFAAFQAGIGERCIDGPTPSDATVIGAYPSPR